ERPAFKPIPMVLRCVVNQNRRSVRFRRIVLQILIEKWLDDIAPDLEGRVTIPAQWTELRSFPVDLTMEPWAHDQEILVVIGVLGFDSKVAVDSAPHVFLVPETLQPDGGYSQRLRRHRFIECLCLPERVIRRMLADFVPPR